MIILGLTGSIGCGKSSLSNILKDNNINYQKRVKIIAQDLDFRSVYMTYIQLSLVGARAKVVQGDTLTKPDIKDENCIFYTPMWKGLL